MSDYDLFEQRQEPATAVEYFEESEKDGLSGGAIAGIIIGVIIAVGVIGVVLWMIFKNKKRGKQQGGMLSTMMGYKETSDNVIEHSLTDYNTQYQPPYETSHVGDIL